MPDYRRLRIPGGTYFFTLNLLERRSDLLVRHIDALRAAVRRTRRERPFRIDAWVVLPEHLHCVLTLPEGDDDFSNRIKAIKIRFVRALPPSLSTQLGEEGGRVWAKRKPSAKSRTCCSPSQSVCMPGSPSPLRARKPPRPAMRRMTVLSVGARLGGRFLARM